MSTEEKESVNQKSVSSFDVDESKNFVTSDDPEQSDIDIEQDIPASSTPESPCMLQEDTPSCKQGIVI